LVPGGSFQMGDLNNTGYTDEKPVHWVHLEPFLLARTEVTQGQFSAVMGTEPWKGQWFVQIGATNAASYIDRYDAATFCTKLGMRLPTEAEWEYACRAGTTTCYHFGENYPPSTVNLGKYAWSWENCFPNELYAHAVAQKLPNAFGLHDMHGNVLEWCVDEYRSDYNRVPTNGSAYDTGLGTVRVPRGGGGLNDAGLCRSADRHRYDPGCRNGILGLRLARPLR
jgi:formylglycine-generating enzyme required for sulfatase activity